MLTLGFELPLALDHDNAIARITDAFTAEGFRVVTRIDMHETFARALKTSFRPYTILGLCNPELAHRALSREPGIGLMLPCNVTVEATGDASSLVRVANPDGMMAVGDYQADAVLRDIASEARERIERAIERLET